MKSNSCDVSFLANELAHAAEITFTVHYVLIKGAYGVPADPPLRSLDQIDRKGIRIPRGRSTGSQFVAAFRQEIKQTGFLADAFTRSGDAYATVAPSADV